MTDSGRDSHKGVGISITSTPDKTEITRAERVPASPKAEMPFRIVYVSDLCPQSPVQDWSEGSLLHRVDKNSFSDLLVQLAPELEIEVPNRLQSAPRMLDVRLKFQSLEDFEPAGVIRRVPALRGLEVIHDLLSEAAGGKVTPDDFRVRMAEMGVDKNWSTRLLQILSAPATSKRKVRRSGSTDSSASNPTLDHLLSMVDDGSGTEPLDAGPEGTVGALISAIGSTERPFDIAAAQQIMGEIKESVTSQVRTIVEHDRFRDLEAAWLGLKFLVDRLDFRSSISLDVLAASAEDLEEAVHYQILMPEHRGEPDEAASLLVFTEAFDHSSASVERLSAIADTAERLQTPMLASLSPKFFDVDSPTELGDLPVVWQHLEHPQYIAWNRFTETSAASFVSVSMPWFLLRTEYVERQSSLVTGLGSSILWGSPAIATAVLIARCYSETGWPTGAVGNREIALENMPVWKSPGGPIPLSANYSTEKEGELADVGFTVLRGIPGQDQVYLIHAPTVVKRRTFEDDAATIQAAALRPLEAQLFISRVVHFLLREQHGAVSGESPDAARDRFETRLRSFLRIAGSQNQEDCLSVTLSPAGSDEETSLLTISVQSPVSMLAERVGFGTQIPVS